MMWHWQESKCIIILCEFLKYWLNVHVVVETAFSINVLPLRNAAVLLVDDHEIACEQ